MELLSQNFINTTTQFVVNSNTATVSNLLIRDTRFQYASDVFNDDNTTVTMTINFDVTTAVSRIALVDHNLKSFTIFYNGATANTFALDAGQDTSASDFISNSETSMYLKMASTVNVTSVTLNLKSTMVANQNKYLGYLVISDVRTDFDGRIPEANGYDTTINPQAVKHTLSDGGTRIQTLSEKRRSKIEFDYLTEATRNTLKEIYDEHLEMIFVPFGTMTGWDEVIYPCVWEGEFNFYRYSDNSANAGFSGSLTLLETPL